MYKICYKNKHKCLNIVLKIFYLPTKRLKIKKLKLTCTYLFLFFNLPSFLSWPFTKTPIISISNAYY